MSETITGDGAEWPDEESLCEIREDAWVLLRTGFLGRAEFVQVVAETHELDAATAELVAGQLWEEQLAEQRSWPEVTDADRVAAAFEALARDGMVARMHFTCCTSCAFSEIGEEATGDTRGFVFFHQQDSEDAAAGGGLLLRYGSFRGKDEEIAAVGGEVVAALKAEGLAPEWDGSPRRAIRLAPLDWRRRLPV